MWKQVESNLAKAPPDFYTSHSSSLGIRPKYSANFIGHAARVELNLEIP